MIPVGVDRPLIRVPWVIISLIVFNTLIFLATVFRSDFEDVLRAYGYVPGYGSFVTLFTSLFLHADFGHLIGNMIFLAMGIKLEDALGHGRFLSFYLGCGLASTMIQHGATDFPIPNIGASGAIAGVLGGFAMLYPFAKIRFVTNIAFYFFSFFCPVFLALGFWFAKEVAYAILTWNSIGGGIAFAAHAGGFFAGAFWAWSFYGWNQGDALDDRATAETSKTVFTAPGYPKA